MTAPTQLALVPGAETQAGRHADDYYRTPAWLTRALCPHLHTFGSVLDAGAGEGSIAQVVEAWALEQGRQVAVTAVELDPERANRLPSEWERHQADFFTWADNSISLQRRYDLVITNPPFVLDGRPVWTRWVDACRPLVTTGGTLAVLAFANILGGQERSGWWRRNRPSRVLLSPKRPQYRTEAKSGDPRDTVWVLWERAGWIAGETRFDWLDLEGGGR